MKTIVQFSESVVARLQSPAQGEADAPAGAIDWARVIELVGEIALMLLTNCPMAQLPGQVTGALKKPDLRQRIKFRAHVAGRCDCCEPVVRGLSAKIADAMLATAAAASDEELAAVVADAVNVDYILI